jgi:site-specific recombinase XerD
MIMAELIEKNVEVNALNIKNTMLGKSKPREHTFLDIFREHNQRVAELVGKEYSPLTLKRYNTILNHSEDFIKLKYETDDLPISQITPDYVSRFDHYLRADMSCAHNTVSRYMKLVKKIVKYCMALGLVRNDPFAGIKFTYKKVDRDFLSEQELQALIDLDISIPRIANVRDTFVFACFTGLAYIDIRCLKQENLSMGDDGNCWLTAKRHKTDSLFSVPVLPKAMEIIERYKGDLLCLKKGTLLPVYSNQKMNAYLKEIADLAGISKHLTFHVARHTFATTVTLNNDVPIETVSKMLGHSSIQMTKVYARLLNKKVGRDMSKLFEIYK